MPKLPFVHTAKRRPCVVGQEPLNVLWMYEQGCLSGAESPTDIQEDVHRQIKVGRAYKSAAKRFAAKLQEQDGMSELEATVRANRLLYDKGSDADSKEDSTVDDENLETETEAGTGTGPGTEANQKPKKDPLEGLISWDDIMNDEEMFIVSTFQMRQVDFEERVATVLVRNRILYPVFLAGPANPDLTALTVQPLSFPVQAGDQIDFEVFKVTVTKFADEGSETIEVKSIPGKLKSGSHGFLLESSGKKKAGVWNDDVTPKVFELLVKTTQSVAGIDRVQAEHKVTQYLKEQKLFDGWTELDTKEQLDPKLIHDIYRLYCRESGFPDPDLPVDEDLELEGGSDDAPLEVTKNSSRSNGTKSSVDSNSLELVTAG